MLASKNDHLTYPVQVRRLTNYFLECADTSAPGLVEGLYLVGSVALDDFQEHSSDVDFVAVTAERPGKAELQGLAKAHQELRWRYPRPFFDGTHLTWADLATGPLICEPAPYTHEGQFEPAGTFAINPVTWHEVARHGLVVRGPSLIDAGIWRDDGALRSWTLDNLGEYWRPWLERYKLGGELFETLDDPLAWGVLGVTRLRYTLATGQITSKSGAGRYAMEAFDGCWIRIISEALRIRSKPAATSAYDDLTERFRAAVDYITMVISDAHNLDEGAWSGL